MPTRACIFFVDHNKNTLSALFYRSNGALSCACSTAYTCILIDLIFPVAFSDSANRALSCTCSARNTSVFDHKSHSKFLLIDLKPVSAEYYCTTTGPKTQ